MKFLKRLTLGIALSGIAVAIAAVVLLHPKYLEYRRIADGFDLGEINRIPAISEVFDTAGLSYGRLPGEVRYVVPLAKISPYFADAVIAREDSRFYEHHGVDFNGIARAAVRNIYAGTVKEGASTITQQLARNTFDLGGDRWRRKIVEALLARRIERHFTKAQIFEAYANRIYYGIGIYGVETASRACFGKSAKDLTLSEAAILAGLIRSPNRLSPLGDSRTALAQRNQVLARMEQLKMITPAAAKAARAESMTAGKRLPPRVLENYAMDAIVRDLAILLPRDLIDRGGLKIYTTVDRRLQLLAEKAVDSRLAAFESEKDWPHPVRVGGIQTGQDQAAAQTESPYLQGALVAIDNASGGIRAIVGGRDFKDSPYNRALLAKRQIGSTFKPFVYAAAFERGFVPGMLIDDSPLRAGEIAGLATAWDPENSDGENLGMQPIETGLIRSRNTMTIRVGEMATRAAVRKLALNAGLERVPDMPAIYLGAFETTLKNLTAAYTMFLNGGLRRQPYIIDRIEDRIGRTIYRASHATLRCISSPVDSVMNDLLGDVLKKGTAAAAVSLGLAIPAAGKTGTTDDYKDAWFVGYTTSLTCGVWVGMDRPQRIMDHGYGSRLALPVWVDFMQSASAWKYVAGNLHSQDELEKVDLCRNSGAIANDGCRAAGSLYQASIPKGLAIQQHCPVHAGIVEQTPLASSVTDGTPMAEANTGIVPVARAVPASSPPVEERPAGAEYRMIRTDRGFIFVNDR